MNLQGRDIKDFDPLLRKFERLRELNMSYNSLERIAYLPANIEELYLNGNKICEVSTSKPKPTLLHLGLSLNKMRSTGLVQIVKNFPNLFCLDLSFNDLCDLEVSITWLEQLPNLKMLSLEGNPLVLTP